VIVVVIVIVVSPVAVAVHLNSRCMPVQTRPARFEQVFGVRSRPRWRSRSSARRDHGCGHDHEDGTISATWVLTARSKGWAWACGFVTLGRLVGRASTWGERWMYLSTAVGELVVIQRRLPLPAVLGFRGRRSGPMKLYVVSSWRNSHQPAVVEALRASGHEVYDFRQPGPGEQGFVWSQVSQEWSSWSVRDFRLGLHHPLARHAFERDRVALEECDRCILVLPSGMSAHLEAGWCAGRGKPVAVFAPDFKEAELMYRLFDEGEATPLFETLEEVLAWLARTEGS
jgi:hypothetical protein